MSQDETDRRLSRREFTRAGLAVAASVAGTALLPSTAAAGHHEANEAANEPQQVTDIAANAALLTAVKYDAVSEIDGKNCENCQLLLQRDSDVGRCGLFQKGVVPVSAYCTSWIQKAGT